MTRYTTNALSAYGGQLGKASGFQPWQTQFHAEATSCNAPCEVTQVTEVAICARYIEVMHQETLSEAGVVHIQNIVTHTSVIGDSTQALLRHIQRLMGHISGLVTP
jgi:hypothetical protein